MHPSFFMFVQVDDLEEVCERLLIRKIKNDNIEYLDSIAESILAKKLKVCPLHHVISLFTYAQHRHGQTHRHARTHTKRAKNGEGGG